MNTYYIYIDESGSFEKSKDHSFVGGFITQIAPESLFQKMQETLQSFQNRYGEVLGLDDLHAAELLHPEKFYKEPLNEKQKEKQIKYTGIDWKIRKEFIQSFQKLVEDVSLCFIKSKNEQFQFGGEDQQSRYGNCLGAWLQKAIEVLDEKEQGNQFQIEFAIARRHQGCLPDGRNHKTYHQRMDDYFQQLIKEHSNIENKKQFILNIKNLLKLSDVACFILRDDSCLNISNSSHVYQTKPNEVSNNSYQNFRKKQQDDLVKTGEIATAYRHALNEQEKGKIFEKLSQIDQKSQATQLRYFLDLSYGLVERRTSEKNALTQAKEIFEKILKTFQNSENEDIQRIVKGAVNGLILCANHSGEVVQQIDLTEQAQKIIQNQKTLPAPVRYAEILEIRNRAWNDQFNDYLFDDIIEGFENEVERYETFIQTAKEQGVLPKNEKDHLLHKLFGTLGQAYAFLSAQDLDYFEGAVQYFEKSLQSFEADLNDLRTPIFFATLYWYHKKFKEAQQILRDYGIVSSSQTLTQSLFKTLEKSDKNQAFCLSILLRLIIEKNLIDLDSLEKINHQIENLFKETHPFELIYKWLGIAYFNLKKQEKAIKCFDKALKIKDGLTMQTINLSTHALKIIACQQLNYDFQKELESFKESLHQVTTDSLGFKIYIEDRGGQESLMQEVEGQEIENVNRWLPFTYA